LTLTLTGAGFDSPLYLFCVAEDGDLIVCEGYLTDTEIPKGAKLSNGTTTITVLIDLPPGIFLQHTDAIGHRLEGPLFFFKETHDNRTAR
jgi:hypothetical protein